jgi:hypothetical protein
MTVNDEGRAVPDIRLQRPIKLPPVPAFTALKEVLSLIAAQDGAWRDFALHVSLGDLHLPDVGYVAIPIALETGETHVETRSIEVRFSSVNHPESFPRFNGNAGIDTTGPSATILWVGGDYDVPLNVVGKIFDRTVAAGVAERALENFIDDLAVAVVASVEKRESEYARYRMY